MKQYPFIFSNELKYRFTRHFVFWLFWWVFSSILYSYTPAFSILPSLQRLPVATSEALVFLSLHMFLSYAFIYFVVPHLLIKERYLLTCLSVIFLFILTGVLNALIARYVLSDARNFIIHSIMGIDRTYISRNEYNSFFLSLLAGLRGGITIAGIAAAIKLTKYWYLKEQRNLQLQKENVEAQLQLLKAQVHPHFLFNTLNNIYSFTQNTAPSAAKLVAGLSDLLRYMLYEGNQTLVPLSKELKMLEDYISLEQVRYQDIDVHTIFPENTNDLHIAPLLLLPFIENCFKHGTSTMVDKPWISLTMITKETHLQMKVVNGKTVDHVQRKSSAGIGIENVRKRLALLYPGKHSLNIIDEEDVFVVDLSVELLKQPILNQSFEKLVVAIHA